MAGHTKLPVVVSFQRYHSSSQNHSRVTNLLLLPASWPGLSNCSRADTHCILPEEDLVKFLNFLFRPTLWSLI